MFTLLQTFLPTQDMGIIQFWIIFIFFITLSIIFIVIKFENKWVIHLFIMIISIIVGFAAMWNFDALLTFVFVIMQILLWLINALNTKI
jgi:hypothetical protein